MSRSGSKKIKIKNMLSLMPHFNIMGREHLFSDISGLFEALVPLRPTFCPIEMCDQQSVSTPIFCWEMGGNVIPLFKLNYLESPQQAISLQCTANLFSGLC